jgi:uncharacterized protein YbaR (Trm112 family)
VGDGRSGEGSVNGVAERVLAILCCPVCRGHLAEEIGFLTCISCRLAYPVVHGVPWMIRERARSLDKVSVARTGERR